MRSIVIGAIVAAGLSLVTTLPAAAAPANVAAIGQAAAEMGSVTQARCCARGAAGAVIAGVGAAGDGGSDVGALSAAAAPINDRINRRRAGPTGARRVFVSGRGD